MIDKRYLVSVDLSSQNQGVTVSNASVSETQIAATTFLTGPTGADGDIALVIQPNEPGVEDRDKIWIDTDEPGNAYLPGDIIPVTTVSWSTTSPSMASYALATQYIATLSTNVSAQALPTPTEFLSGSIILRLKGNDGTARTWTPPTNVKWDQNVTPVITVTNTSKASISLTWIGGGEGWEGRVQGQAIPNA